MENIRCTKDEMIALSTIDCDEKYRIEHDGVHLIDADPSLLLAAPDLSEPVILYLESAASEGVRVNVFPASSSICRP
jgi:hypothetical protein